MSELAAEKEQEINEARMAWYEAEEELRKLQDDTPVMLRTGLHWMTIAEQRQKCGTMKMKFQRAERDRYNIIPTQSPRSKENT